MTARIYSEDQFPLNDNERLTEADMPADPSSFPVLVTWGDVEESPSHAVARLNAEAMEHAGRHAEVKAQLDDHVKAFDGLGEFKIVSANQTADLYHGRYHDGVRAVVHVPCGTLVGSLPVVDFELGRMVKIAMGHDCSAEALVNATGEGKLMARRAISLLDGADDATNPEYLRALVEMVCDVAGLQPERKDEVADLLWDKASTYGDRPAI